MEKTSTSFKNKANINYVKTIFTWFTHCVRTDQQYISKHIHIFHALFPVTKHLIYLHFNNVSYFENTKLSNARMFHLSQEPMIFFHFKKMIVI